MGLPRRALIVARGLTPRVSVRRDGGRTEECGVSEGGRKEGRKEGRRRRITERRWSSPPSSTDRADVAAIGSRATWVGEVVVVV
ncbi:hypothetical protein NL676_011487 [Syzygium grande]|nr:hypothetical protein NL676_011487 [Syzygium grande]